MQCYKIVELNLNVDHMMTLLGNCFCIHKWFCEKNIMEEDAVFQNLVEFSAGQIQLENNGKECKVRGSERDGAEVFKA